MSRDDDRGSALDEPVTFRHLNFKVDDSSGAHVFYMWPKVFVHSFDISSPFYDVGPDDLPDRRIELIVRAEFCVESTGATTCATISYLPEEILWGRM